MTTYNHWTEAHFSPSLQCFSDSHDTWKPFSFFSFPADSRLCSRLQTGSSETALTVKTNSRWHELPNSLWVIRNLCLNQNTQWYYCVCFKMVEGFFFKDAKRLESGIQLINEAEIAGYLSECENILRQQVVDIQVLLDGKFPFADQLVQRWKKTNLQKYSCHSMQNLISFSLFLMAGYQNCVTTS